MKFPSIRFTMPVVVRPAPIPATNQHDAAIHAKAADIEERLTNAVGRWFDRVVTSRLESVAEMASMLVTAKLQTQRDIELETRDTKVTIAKTMLEAHLASMRSNLEDIKAGRAVIERMTYDSGGLTGVTTRHVRPAAQDDSKDAAKEVQ